MRIGMFDGRRRLSGAECDDSRSGAEGIQHYGDEFIRILGVAVRRNVTMPHVETTSAAAGGTAKLREKRCWWRAAGAATSGPVYQCQNHGIGKKNFEAPSWPARDGRGAIGEQDSDGL